MAERSCCARPGMPGSREAPSGTVQALALMLTLAACVQPLDTSRDKLPALSLGGAVYLELCNRIASADNADDVSGESTRAVCRDGETPPPGSAARLVAFHGQRQRFISAIDAAIDESLATDLDALLVELLPLYDSGDVQAQTRAIAGVVQELAASDEALAALERMGAREGYRPVSIAVGLVRPLLTYERLEPFVRQLTGIVRPGGAGEGPWLTLLDGTSHELAEMAPATDDPACVALARDLLLREDPAFSDGKARYIAKRDARGVVIPTSTGGRFLAPFSDGNADGLADIDQHGRLVGSDGKPVKVPAPFQLPNEAAGAARDSYGRLLQAASGTELVYEYRDTSPTLIAGILHESRSLFVSEMNVWLDVAAPLAKSIGPRTPRQHSFADGATVSFEGFDLARSPVLDLTHAGTAIVDDPAALSAIGLVDELLRKQEPAMAAAAELVTKVSDWCDDPAVRDAALEPHSALIDDLLEIVVKIVRVPGLVEDILAAFEDPRTALLGKDFASYMRYRDGVDYDPNDVNGPPVGTPHVPVDRTQPDTRDNRSLFARFTHLTHDVNHARFCNKAGAVMALGAITYPLSGSYDQCELLEIDNLAVFYLKAIIGTAELEFKDPVVDLASNLDFLLETFSGIDGFTRYPTPQAINRIVFAPRNDFLKGLIDPPRSSDGGVLEERHPATIFSWELYGFFEHMKPLVTAFAKHDRLDLFVDLLSVVHKHWPSPASDTTQSLDPLQPLYAKQSGVVRFEDVIAKALDEGRLFGIIGDFLAAARNTVVGTTPGRQVLADATRQLALPEWNTGLRRRDGGASVKGADGRNITELSPAWLMLAAARDLDTALGPASTSESISAVLGRMARQLFAVNHDTGSARFSDRRALAIAQTLVGFAKERLQAHQDAGDIRAWGASITPDLQELLDHPAAAAGIDLGIALGESAEARPEIESLMLYLVDVLSPHRAFDSTLTSTADFTQILDDVVNLRPLVRELSPLFDAETGAVNKAIVFLDKAQALDDEQVLPRLLAGLMNERAPGSGETALEALIDVVGIVNRIEPGTPGPLSREDYRSMLNGVVGFLSDDTRGLERLYQLIENR